MTALSEYKGATALVTGAGDGIGEMLAKKFAQSGMRVCVQDIREEAANRVAGEIGGDAFPLVFDVSDQDGVARAAEEFAAQSSALNLLWLNAGVGVGASILKGNPRTIRWAFEVNVFGIIWTAQAFRPLLDPANGPAHVGITASSAAIVAPDGEFPLYATTKHGTMATAEALRGELAVESIGTTILCPGLLNSEIWNGAKARPERFGGERHMDEKIAKVWREAKDPVVMWPHIARSIEEGGGYLICQTDPATQTNFDARVKTINAGIVEV
jgi:NAD(P)-dependent dehydrogenase (short-subunit alcohol dehydrogenase family)